MGEQTGWAFVWTKDGRCSESRIHTEGSYEALKALAAALARGCSDLDMVSFLMDDHSQADFEAWEVQ